MSSEAGEMCEMAQDREARQREYVAELETAIIDAVTYVPGGHARLYRMGEKILKRREDANRRVAPNGEEP